MTRMIERWFPCADVSSHSRSGWGSGNSEIQLFPWFAKRPTAQAKAAVICSLLPWPDDEAEQKHLQGLVRLAMTGRYAAVDALRSAILQANGQRTALLDPFSGRGMIPLESARLGLPAYGVDYSPVAVLASHLLTDYPFRDWSSEPEIAFTASDEPAAENTDPKANETDKDRGFQLRIETAAGELRLVRDVDAVLAEVGRRYEESMDEFYPTYRGKRPWAYLWAVSLPCSECGRSFPLVGSYELRPPSTRRGERGEPDLQDPGQSFYIDADQESGKWEVVVHEGKPRRTPIRQVPTGKSRYDASGKVAACPFCTHPHAKNIHIRMAADELGHDALLLACDIDTAVGKSYRPVTEPERQAVDRACQALAGESGFSPLLPARPAEGIPPGNTWTVQATVYGAKTYGDLMNDRQTLSFIRLAKAIEQVAAELRSLGVSRDYTRALAGYAGAVLARKLRRATRGATLDPSRQGIHDIFQTESSLNYSYDYLEVGLGDGPGSWNSVADGTKSALATAVPPFPEGPPVDIRQGSAAELPFASEWFDVVVTDPPYEAMIDYTDASDLFYVWLKRALFSTWPELSVTSSEFGVQEKTEEIIVKKGGTTVGDPRDRDHYDRLITKAFSEARRVVHPDGVVTIVFGHGEPEVWRRLLASIQGAGLVLSGSWPAKTEQGGKSGFSNIVTTLTMACRPAMPNRPVGLKAQVQSQIKAAVKSRIDMWERSGLAPTDMLMAAAGPAMEIVGHYSQVKDITGAPLDPMGYPIGTDLTRPRRQSGKRPGQRPQGYLEWARQAVQEYARIEIDHHPLETFDARTRFALWWIQLFRKSLTADSELRWQTLAADLDERSVQGIIIRTKKGARFADAQGMTIRVSQESAVIDVAMAMAAAWPEGMKAVGEVLASAERQDDPFLWAAVTFLSERFPESDPDAMAWTKILRNRIGVMSAAKAVAAALKQEPWGEMQGMLDFPDLAGA